MAMHSGKTYYKGDVSLEAPLSKSIDHSTAGNPEDGEWRQWREQASTQDDIYYFSIHLNGILVGELFLHDINLNARESLLGYRIFLAPIEVKALAGERFNYYRSLLPMRRF